MSTSSETKPPSFSQTCSMLHQFLKEKGTNLNDLNLDMQLPNHNGSGEMFRQMTQQPTKNYFPFMEKSRNVQAARGFKSMDLFPQQAGFGSSLPKLTDTSSLKSSLVSVEHQMAQMTIFYDGKVHVYNNLPAEKAKEMMLLASQESYKAHQAAHVPAPVNAGTNSAFASQFGTVQINSGTAPVAAPSSNPFPKFGNPVIQQQEAIKPTPTRPIITDIPLQRKASLQRFLEKRKDRINNMAPYQMSSPGSSSNPAKPAADGKSWLNLAAQPTQ